MGRNARSSHPISLCSNPDRRARRRDRRARAAAPAASHSCVNSPKRHTGRAGLHVNLYSKCLYVIRVSLSIPKRSLNAVLYAKFRNRSTGDVSVSLISHEPMSFVYMPTGIYTKKIYTGINVSRQ